MSVPPALPPVTGSPCIGRLGLKLVNPSILPANGLEPSPEGVVSLLQLAMLVLPSMLLLLALLLLLVMPGLPPLDIPASRLESLSELVRMSLPVSYSFAEHLLGSA